MTPISDSLIQIPEGIPWVSVVDCTLQYQIVNGTRCSVLSPDVPIDVVETQAASMTQPTIRNRGRS